MFHAIFPDRKKESLTQQKATWQYLDYAKHMPCD